MAKDRAADDERVDDWDEAEDAAPSLAAGGPPTAAVGPAEANAGADVTGEPEPRRELSWREVVRNTPLWIWLISVTAFGGICVMFFTVMLILAFGK